MQANLVYLVQIIACSTKSESSGQGSRYSTWKDHEVRDIGGVLSKQLTMVLYRTLDIATVSVSYHCGKG
jgi:hypothetical protein